MKRLRASSLVLVVVVMAGIIIVVFGASRLTLVQYNQSNRDEDNIFALSAARAGIEDGLLRFRYNRDAETGSNGTKVARYNLTTGVSAGEVDQNSKSNFALNEQYYDMKLSFRGGQIGTFDTDTQESVAKDELLELTGFPNEPDRYYLRYWFEFVDCGNTPRENRLVQIQQVSQTTSSGNLIAYDQITVKYPANGTTVDSKDSNHMFIRTTLGSDNSLASSIRLRPYGCSIKYSLATSLTDTGQANDGPNFDSSKSIITSTGYYGAAKRTLIAEINRLSGQLISIYDFNIYSGTGDIKSVN
ncbi:MAG: hypothetical protein Q7K33_00790 [Candidatus Berkelbacteria bacterium]|nr:hypothetical protein [Candidatus Berkelbacteria bacterium]